MDVLWDITIIDVFLLLLLRFFILTRHIFSLSLSHTHVTEVSVHQRTSIAKNNEDEVSSNGLPYLKYSTGSRECICLIIIIRDKINNNINNTHTSLRLQTNERKSWSDLINSLAHLFFFVCLARPVAIIIFLLLFVKIRTSLASCHCSKL